MKMRTTKLDDGTRARVLRAAGETFANRGYSKATVREIVERAGANVNAVNYYFGGKRKLYLAVFEQAHRCAHENAADGDRDPGQTPDCRLREFVGRLLRGLQVRTPETWFPRLMMRELTEPTDALDDVVQSCIRPRFDALVALVRELTGPRVPQRKVELCALSIISQCVHVARAYPIVSRLITDMSALPGETRPLAEHIAGFSLAALREIVRQESQHE